MVKQLILPLIGVAVFIIAVGLFIQKSGSINIPNLPAVPSSAPVKSMTIGGKSINVEIANTTELRAKGLSGRALLGVDNGMLFVFADESHASSQKVEAGFWMKDMLIPLDIIWINNGAVAKIDKNIQPPAPGTPDSHAQDLLSAYPIRLCSGSKCWLF